MPGLEQMMNAFPLDKRAGKNCAKDWRSQARLKPLDIHAARKVEELFFSNSAFAKSVGRFFREYEQKGGKIVFFDGTFRAQNKFVFPATKWSPLSGFWWVGAGSYTLGKIPVPCRNLHNGGNPHPLGNVQ